LRSFAVFAAQDDVTTSVGAIAHVESSRGLPPQLFLRAASTGANVRALDRGFVREPGNV
jgi:hypothetical protein